MSASLRIALMLVARITKTKLARALLLLVTFMFFGQG